MTKVVVIGGVAAGMSAASQAKRREPDAEVVVFERGPHVSYGACGMPYFIMDPYRHAEDLVVITADRFRRERGIDVRTGSEVLSIDAARREVKVDDRQRVRRYAEPYDKLVIATGASPVVPPFVPRETPGVFLLRTLEDGAAIKAHLDRLGDDAGPRRAVIIGGGYIGLEMSESLSGRGLEVTLVEREPQVAPGFDPVIADKIAGELDRQRVRVLTGASVDAIERGGGGLVVRAGSRRLEAELVLVSVGVRPNVALARDAGVTLGASGAIRVDRAMRTDLPDVFAAGDCVEAPHRVTGEAVWVPLGTTANKQGKVAGANAVGAGVEFAGIVGTAAFKVFDLEVGRTGLGARECERSGLDWLSAASRQASRAHSYPGAKPIDTVVFAERGSGRLLGAQMVGAAPVAKRIDIFATALAAGMSLEDIEGLDLSYAPPIAPVYDPVLVAATVGRKAATKAEKREKHT